MDRTVEQGEEQETAPVSPVPSEKIAPKEAHTSGPLTEAECEELVECILTIGAEMVRNGAEVRRAEDTMLRIAKAYHFQVMSSYAVTAQVELSLKAPDGKHYTQALRIKRTWNDLGRVEALNADARRICNLRPPIASLKEYITPSEKKKRFRFGEFIGYPISAFGFAVFFGGSFWDGLASAAVAVGMYLMDRFIRLRKHNYFVYTLVACFFSGCLAELFYKVGFGGNIDKIMIGDIMLFIPGLAMVNGIKEMFYRDILTGILRILEALLVAAAIAVGYALAILLFAAL